MDYSKKWKNIGTLGEGGQGKVYRVFKLEIDSKIKSSVIDTLKKIVISTTHHEITTGNYERFFEALSEMLKMQDPSQQGALKVLHEPQEARDAELAPERIKREIKAMSDNLHPHLIRILDVDPDSAWYVSQFYPNGTLWDKREMFKGNFSKALKAIRPLVDAVATLHEKGYVHRDIKPQNVFLNSNNELILGDFGLIYFEDNQRTRISRTYENVGSRDWMPPWAMGRIEEITPAFDVFCIGKLLWSMLSGKSFLRLWYFDEDEFNVEKLFPDSREMRLANQLFEKCIVQFEESCLKDAGELLKEIDKTISRIELGADVLDPSIERICRVCGLGKYQLLTLGTQNFGFRPTGPGKFKIFSCSHCGNVQLFFYENRLPKAWKK